MFNKIMIIKKVLVKISKKVSSEENKVNYLKKRLLIITLLLNLCRILSIKSYLSLFSFLFINF